jgi:hypothetical protein
MRHCHGRIAAFLAIVASARQGLGPALGGITTEGDLRQTEPSRSRPSRSIVYRLRCLRSCARRAVISSARCCAAYRIRRPMLVRLVAPRPEQVYPDTYWRRPLGRPGRTTKSWDCQNAMPNSLSFSIRPLLQRRRYREVNPPHCGCASEREGR